jgi:EamA-like transporter family
MGALGWAAAGLGMRYLSVREAGFDVWGATTAQFFCGGVPLLPYLIASGGARATDWSSPKLWASLVFLVIGAQVITYVGSYIALAQWTSARVFAWTFLAPAVAVVIEALQGNLPGTVTTVGLAIVIAGVAIVTRPGQRQPELCVPTPDPRARTASAMLASRDRNLVSGPTGAPEVYWSGWLANWDAAARLVPASDRECHTGALEVLRQRHSWQRSRRRRGREIGRRGLSCPSRDADCGSAWRGTSPEAWAGDPGDATDRSCAVRSAASG